MNIIPTILCGGAGSRLWPVSRELHPKPFIRLADGRSLLQKAFLRGAMLPAVDEILTVTNTELFFKTASEFQEVNQQKLRTGFILEPFGRNTAAAIAAAALRTASVHGGEAIMLVLPADHIILDEPAFSSAVAKAAALAQAGKLVTFGIEPDSPETGYGYIEAEGSRVLRFVEKPSLELATQYVASGRFLWNSGMFCFKADAMLKALDQHCPEIYSGMADCIGKAQRAKGAGYDALELDAPTLAAVPDRSIDYAVMEKAANVAVVPCSIGWSDIGSWRALGDLAPADARGNRVDGDALLHDSSDCYVRSDKRMVAGVGLRDLVIVDTADALLVADKSRTQEVKHLYEKLKSAGHPAHKHHVTVHRPWGTYTVLEEGPNFKIKRIVVKPGASLSLQMHHHRSEHWVVVHGMARVRNGERELFVRTNESTYIPAGHQHRLENPGMIDLIMIEVQSGEYLGEDDIVRFEDAYGRN